MKNNIRNHPYHQVYPVLGKIWINWIRINRGLLFNRWVDNNFFTKSEEYLRAKYLEGALKRGLGRGKCFTYLPLNTPLYITLTMIVYKNMKPIEHVLLHPICLLSHLICACKYRNAKLSLYYWTHWSFWRIFHFKNTDLTRFFIIKPRHPGRLINRSGWTKKLIGSPAHMRENAYYRNLKWTIKGLLPCYCYAIKTKSTTIRLQVSQSHLQAKNRTRANSAVALSVSGALRLRLCPDEPRVHLSGPAYMPSCIDPEVRLSLYQRVLRGDCCKKCTMSSPGLLLFCDIFGA